MFKKLTSLTLVVIMVVSGSLGIAGKVHAQTTGSNTVYPLVLQYAEIQQMLTITSDGITGAALSPSVIGSKLGPILLGIIKTKPSYQQQLNQLSNQIIGHFGQLLSQLLTYLGQTYSSQGTAVVNVSRAQLVATNTLLKTITAEMNELRRLGFPFLACAAPQLRAAIVAGYLATGQPPFRGDPTVGPGCSPSLLSNPNYASVVNPINAALNQITLLVAGIDLYLALNP
mgnify:CR=1 FL=1